ncbi:hypothetical protein M5E87_03320 [Flavonifractor plautii]|nr:hypothetical protein M5E87_03320 [Flavonifractor plautii]
MKACPNPLPPLPHPRFPAPLASSASAERALSRPRPPCSAPPAGVPGRLRESQAGLRHPAGPRRCPHRPGAGHALPCPHSYTGEDTAELQCHGSPAVLAMALEALFAQGVRQAGPGSSPSGPSSTENWI